MQRGQLHSKQVLKASLIIPPLTPRPGHVTQAADELGRVGWEGEGLETWGGGGRCSRLAPHRRPFRGRPVSRDDLPMTLYHLTPEGSEVILSYQPGSRRSRGRMDDESGEESEAKMAGKGRNTERV